MAHSTPCQFITYLKEAYLVHSPPSHYLIETREANMDYSLYIINCYLIGMIVIQVIRISISKLQLPSVAPNHIQ